MQLSVRSVGFEDPSGGVRSGQTDVALVWQPFSTDGLEIEELVEVERVAVLPVDHPLAGAETLDARELAKEPFVWVEDIDPVVGDFWSLAAYRSEPLSVGARITSFDDAFAAVRAGQAVMVPPEPLTSSLGLPGLVVRHVGGLARAVVAFCRREGDARPVVEAFAATARACAVRDAPRGQQPRDVGTELDRGDGDARRGSSGCRLPGAKSGAAGG